MAATFSATFTVRDMLIGQISDDYKSAWGCRPRFNYDAMNLVQLKELADQAYQAAYDAYLEEEEEYGDWLYMQEQEEYYARQEYYRELEEAAHWQQIDDIYERNNW